MVGKETAEETGSTARDGNGTTGEDGSSEEMRKAAGVSSYALRSS